jgi:phage-related protein
MATHIVSFNDYDLTDIVEAHSDQSNTRVAIQTVPKRHGGLLTDIPVLDIRKVQLKGVYYGSTPEATRDKIREVEAALGYTKAKLRLYSDRYYYAWKTDFSHSYVPNTGMLVVIMTMGFACDDPFEYADDGDQDSSQVLSTGDPVVDITHGYYRKTFTLTNNGSALAYLKVTVSADQTYALTKVSVKNTSLSPERQEAYTAGADGTGVVSAATSLVMDNAIFSVQNNGVDDLKNWLGTFLWLAPGDNVIEIEGEPATYLLEWNERYV